MPALNFKAQFADAVESGEKRQTIRAYRKDGRDPKPGDRLVLYTGMRTKACRKLGEAVCVEVCRISLSREADPRLDGQPLGPRQRQTLAQQDGFRGNGPTPYGEMIAFFEQTHGLPFEGLLIRWEREEEDGGR